MGRTLIVAAALVLAAGPVHAALGTADSVPAATLLLPYFEVGTDESTSGINTTFSVRNISNLATLAHVMIFTDYSVGSFGFDLYFTGYDVETIDVGQLLRGEFVPDTCFASAFGFGDCSDALSLSVDTPVASPPPAPTTDTFADDFESGDLSRWSRSKSRATALTLAAFHTGGSSERTGLCAGSNQDDAIARGYILIDVTETLAGDAFPDEIPNYFTEVAGTDANDNVLWGEYEIRNDLENFAFANSLFAIETGGLLPSPGGASTFYARYHNNAATDARETIPSRWSARFVDGGSFDAGASILYWRDPEVVQHAFPCDTPPTWTPLSQASIVVFDEQSNAEVLAEVSPFPNACGRVEVGSSAFPTTFPFGWLFVDFENVAGLNGLHNQAVIAITASSAGRFQSGQYGTPFNTAPVNPGELVK